MPSSSSSRQRLQTPLGHAKVISTTEQAGSVKRAWPFSTVMPSMDWMDTVLGGVEIVVGVHAAGEDFPGDGAHLAAQQVQLHRAGLGSGEVGGGDMDHAVLVLGRYAEHGDGVLPFAGLALFHKGAQQSGVLVRDPLYRSNTW